MATTNEIYHLMIYLRHLNSFTLLGYRDTLRNETLSAVKPVLSNIGEKPLISVSSLALVNIIDVSREGGQYMTKGTHETAINHHIATNLILKERGFTKAIDAPELKIDMS